MGAKENAAQQARSKRYDIDIRDDGNVTKPEEWAGLSDSQFGDPVNYMYPISDAARAESAKTLFDVDVKAEKYSGRGERVVRGRINRLCRKWEVDPIKADTTELANGFMVGEIFLGDAEDEEGDSGVVRIPAARTATLNHPWWGAIHLDDDLFESFIDNWQTDVVGHKLAIDPSHQPEDGALAWFEDITIEPADDGKPGLVIYARKTSLGEGVLGDVFKYCSIEYTENYVDRETGVEYGPTLRGAAATNRPFVNRQSAMTTLNVPADQVPEASGDVHFVFLTTTQEDEQMMIEAEDTVGTGQTLADGTEVVSLDQIEDPGEPEEVIEEVPAPAEEPVIPTQEVTAMSETAAPAEIVQVGTVTLTEEDVRGIIAQNLQLKQTVKDGRVSEVADKAMARGVPPVIVDAAKQILMALEPDAEPTITFTEPGESARTVNLFDAVAALVDSVPGRGGELTLTDVGEKPPETVQTGNPYTDEVELSPEEAEADAVARRKQLGINSINTPNSAAL